MSFKMSAAPFVPLVAVSAGTPAVKSAVTVCRLRPSPSTARTYFQEPVHVSERN